MRSRADKRTRLLPSADHKWPCEDAKECNSTTETRTKACKSTYRHCGHYLVAKTSVPANIAKSLHHKVSPYRCIAPLVDKVERHLCQATKGVWWRLERRKENLARPRIEWDLWINLPEPRPAVSLPSLDAVPLVVDVDLAPFPNQFAHWDLSYHVIAEKQHCEE